VKLEIWYQQQTANDYSEGNPAITVATVEELDAFVDRVVTDSCGGAVPPMIEVAIADGPDSPVMHVGLGRTGSVTVGQNV
jgi:hypothetical protein